MHTDEYEISLSRELKVCNNYIHSLQKWLLKMEIIYNLTSDEFVKGYCNGLFSADNRDFQAWFKAAEELKRWEARRNEFEQMYRLMRI
jgi:hypothetical protein